MRLVTVSGGWVWGVQRAVDYLVTAPSIDPRRIVVTGHSRLGKAALLVAAFDERIALATPQLSQWFRIVLSPTANTDRATPAERLAD